jgi:diaminopimelate epimerase
MMERIEFYKMTGGGNDFIIIDNREEIIDVKRFRPSIPKICRRKLSVGADGLIIIEHSDQAHFRWQFFNADGSQAEMCGNGGRCVARLAYLLGIAPPELTFETSVGILRAQVRGKVVKLALPPPSNIELGLSLRVGEDDHSIDFINTGVPHAVIFTQNLEEVEVVNVGRSIRYHQAFQPAGTNVDFIRINNNEIHIRTYERGVEDETLACGTGAVAAAIIANLRGKTTSPTRVIPRSGEVLSIHYRGEKDIAEVSLEGEVTLVYRGWLWKESIS